MAASLLEEEEQAKESNAQRETKAMRKKAKRKGQRQTAADALLAQESSEAAPVPAPVVVDADTPTRAPTRRQTSFVRHLSMVRLAKVYHLSGVMLNLVNALYMLCSYTV